MTRFVALFRGVNVGGNTRLPMGELKALALELGYAEPQTLLNSGNLVFSSAEPARETKRRLEAAIGERFGFTPTTFLRDATQWRAIIDANPLRDEAAQDPSHLLVTVLRDTPPEGAIEALRAAIVGRETVALAGTTLYTVYPDGIGRSKLDNPLVEKTLKTRGTARNWNTVLKLATLLEG